VISHRRQDSGEIGRISVEASRGSGHSSTLWNCQRRGRDRRPRNGSRSARGSSSSMTLAWSIDAGPAVCRLSRVVKAQRIQLGNVPRSD